MVDPRPRDGLFTSCTVSGLPKDLEREAQLFRFEFRDDEPSTFGSLIADGRTVAPHAAHGLRLALLRAGNAWSRAANSLPLATCIRA